MLFMAIVIPVALQGLRMASTAGEVGQRKMIAARIGNKVLNELKVTGQLQNTGQSGVVQDHGIELPLDCQESSVDRGPAQPDDPGHAHRQLPAQGKNYDVHLSTLVAPPQQPVLSTRESTVHQRGSIDESALNPCTKN
jgi:hypothetical protein